MGFDELTSLPSRQYLYLFSRLRRPATSASCRCACGRPQTRAGWATSGYEHVSSMRRPKVRIFIPARLADNPHLDQGSYRANLCDLDAVTRAQLLGGRLAGTPRGRAISNALGSPSPRRPPPQAHRVRYWDKAATEERRGAHRRGAHRHDHREHLLRRAGRLLRPVVCPTPRADHPRDRRGRRQPRCAIWR